jgi:hypothetical protein
MAKMLVD